MSQEEKFVTMSEPENSTESSSSSSSSSQQDSSTTRRDCEVIDVTEENLGKDARKRKEREEDDIEREILETGSPDKKRERMSDEPKDKEKEEKKDLIVPTSMKRGNAFCLRNIGR